jgi:hypothetical protein
MRMLNAHPRVLSRGEVFLRYGRAHEGSPRRPDPFQYLRRDMLRAGRRHYVFSFHFLRVQHLRPDLVDVSLEAFVDAMPGLGVAGIVLLERRNYLRVLLSSRAGELREHWHVPPEVRVELRPFAFDPHVVEIGCTRMGLVEWLEEFERGFTEARRLVAARGGLHLTYEEDVLPDPRIGYRKLCELLGERAVEVEVPLARANPFAIREMLRNFDVVQRHLRGTRFAWMLDAN